MSTKTNSSKVQMKDLRMVFFPSIEEAQKARRIKEVHAVVLGKGPLAIIVPGRIVPFIKKRALVSYVLEPSDKENPTPEQIKAMIKRIGAFKDNFFITRELLREITHAKTKKT